MSDGMSDARAMDELDNELHQAAENLNDAIRRARNGHRGTPSCVRTARRT